MQEAFARLATRTENGSVTDPRAWLFRVVHNLVVDDHRRSGARGIVEVRESPPLEERGFVWHEVDTLPVRQRAVIYLRYRMDLDYATIAGILGITEGGARANGAKALAHLRDRMGDR